MPGHSLPSAWSAAVRVGRTPSGQDGWEGSMSGLPLAEACCRVAWPSLGLPDCDIGAHKEPLHSGGSVQGACHHVWDLHCPLE